MESKLFFDPVHRILSSSCGQVLKHVNCPENMSWSNLKNNENNEFTYRHCDSCNKPVVNTERMTSDEIIEALVDTPTACLKIRLGQENIKIKVSSGQ